MLSEKAQKAILKHLKFDDAKIAELMKAGEFEVDIPKQNILSDDELTQLKNNLKKGHEESYPEIWGKKMNDEHSLGLSSSDAKDHVKVIEALKAKHLKDANIAEGDKITALNKDIEKLRATVAEKENESKGFQSKLKERDIHDQYRALLPEKRNKFLTDDEHIARIKSVVGFDENGNPINASTKEVYKDKLASPRKAKEVVEEIYASNEGWLQPEGAGGSRSTLGIPNGQGGKGGNTKGIDHMKRVEEIRAKHDMGTLEGRQAFNDEMVAMALNDAK